MNIYSFDPDIRADVAAFLAQANASGTVPLEQLPPELTRAGGLAMRELTDAPLGSLAVLRDLEILGPASTRLSLRVYDASEERSPGPVVVFFHGGGWVLGGFDTHDSLCAEIARETNLPVVAVDYRLAPENPWPAAPDDCEAASRWIASGPNELGLSPTGLVLAGDSAGGNLALVTAQALRDRPGIVPVMAQWALYPPTDMTKVYPSYDLYSEGRLLTKAAMDWFERQYAAVAEDTRASPLLGSLGGLPPALIMTSSLDPSRDEGRAYAAKLIEAGVDTIFLEARGLIHGWANMRRAFPSAQLDLETALSALTTILERSSGQSAGR